jgi:hypothetical protein
MVMVKGGGGDGGDERDSDYGCEGVGDGGGERDSGGNLDPVVRYLWKKMDRDCPYTTFSGTRTGPRTTHLGKTQLKTP